MTEVSELSTENRLTLVVQADNSAPLTIPSIKTGGRADTTVELASGGALAMAGMISEQTKQQLNGIPGFMQLPILGALFKSRDFVNKQSELMVLVTSYIVRAVAQRELSRPDDGYADASDPASIPAGSIARASRGSPITAGPASFSADRRTRGHHRCAQPIFRSRSAAPPSAQLDCSCSSAAPPCSRAATRPPPR
jgi:pilus assembly protein CpaC